MNKHELLTDEQFRNTLYYHLTQKKISKETYDLVIEEKDKSEATEKELEELKRDVKRHFELEKYMSGNWWLSSEIELEEYKMLKQKLSKVGNEHDT